MKRNYLKIAAMLLVLAGGFGSCGKNEKNTDENCIPNFVHDESANIIGKWKLVKTRFYSMYDGTVTCTDYSQCNIVYEFKENNVLTISAKPETPEWFANEIGEHVYSIIEDGAEYGPTFKIDKTGYWYSISSGSKKLILDQAPVDGGTIYLIKIQ